MMEHSPARPENAGGSVPGAISNTDPLNLQRYWLPGRRKGARSRDQDRRDM